MTTSSPPTKNVRIIVEAVVDLVAILTLGTLAALRVVDAATVVPVIVLIAGARVGSKLKGDGGGAGSATSVLLFAAAPLLQGFLRRHHGGDT